MRFWSYEYRFSLLKQLFSNTFTSFLNLFFSHPVWHHSGAAAIFTAPLKMWAQIFVAMAALQYWLHGKYFMRP